MRLCLNMIVKNESARIERALASVVPYLTSWVIVDTGSTDDTKEKITRFFQTLNIPGELREAEFVDWSQARNVALDAGRDLAFIYKHDTLLLMDADMELVVKDPDVFKPLLPGDSKDMWQHAGSMHYLNRRLVSVRSLGKYVGVTHEYLDMEAVGMIPETDAFFIDHADGANRPEKFRRDINLLKAGLRAEPNNVRYFFYLANSYRDAGKPRNAIIWYERRIAAGGWDEEVWQSEVYLAHCYKDLGREADFIRTLLSAYNRRPQRAESMYDLARWYRDQPSSQAAALACAEAVEHLPKSTDALFVNDFVYKAGIKEEIAICAWYVPGKRQKGYETCAALAQQKSNYWGAINTARSSLFHYLLPLKDFCPSFEWKNVDFQAPDGYVPTNPSVCVHHGKLHVNVRCVNYRMDDEGRYLIRNTETGDINNQNPIHTRNFVLAGRNGPFFDQTYECYHDGNMQVEYPLVIGFEDLRIWSRDHELWSSAAVRQLYADGVPEQVLSRLVPAVGDDAVLQHDHVKRMLRNPRECEKNWAPILGPQGTKDGKHLFMWRPGVVINSGGEFVKNNAPNFAVDNLSGSSQVIPWKWYGDPRYLAVLHTAHTLPGRDYMRYYYHRFVEYNADFEVTRLSLPFYFNEKAIEFCAGLCFDPAHDEDRLVLSYGFKDCEARIATVSTDDVEKLLCLTPLPS